MSVCRLWMLVLLAVGTTVTSQGQETILENAANEFIIGFTVNAYVSFSFSLLLFVTTQDTNPVMFTVTANGFNFTGTAFNNSSTEVSIPSTFQVRSNRERNKGIYVKAEGDSKIVVYGLSYYVGGTSDAFLALPCSNLEVEEYEYYAMTYPDTRPQFTSDVLLVGCEDNTLVTTPSNTITLNKLETYLIESSDSTGMRITSTKPVSFFSNQKCTDIPTNNLGCDHLTEQIPPTSTWGTSFYVASLLGRNSGELFRIITAKNSTTVRLNCTTFSQVQVYNLSVAGNWQEFEIRPLSFCNIESSAPILVTQFALGRGRDNKGDPFMMIIPPVEQYSNNYVLNVLSNFSTNYVTIYVATEYYQPNRIFVDNTSQVVSSWTSVYCSNSLLCGYITRVNLTAGEHRLYHQDPHARIGVSAYGFNSNNSYGYPGGLKLTSIQSTALPQLNVTVTGGSGTLTAGQNHLLTCEASGDGSMAYTYMWLRNDSVVSGQTSATYSFSPLLVVHSGQYNCQVTVGSMTVTSESVDITVEKTATQLYFTWRGNRYEPGDSILITDIRFHDGDAGPGDSLVCVTTDVNTQCCTDVGGVGEWFFPNGSMVLHNNDFNGSSQIIKTGRANQVRLNFRTRQTSPTGEYTCVVPETGGSVIQTVGIRLVSVLPRLYVILTGSGGTLTEGKNHTLTCTASGGGSMAYTYMWLKNDNLVFGQTSSTYSFSPLSVTDSGEYICQVSIGSVNMTSEAVTITVVDAVPNPPSDLRATTHTATSITITWTETTTTNIDRYEVTYSYTVRRCSAPAGSAMTNITSTLRSQTLTNLNEDSIYTITVRNINGAVSNMSTITANTATAVPSAGPSSVTLTTVGTTNITIEWSELDCTDRNGDITGYRVRYGPTSTTPSQRQIATISGRMFTVDREFITLSYDFEVAAVNMNGIGPYNTPPLTVDTAVPSGLGFYLNGMAYSNNSVVTITDIGEGDMSLYCITSRSECCRISDGGERGDWFLPGQDSAVEGTSRADFSKRREPRAVVLDRRNNAVVPIGLYRCEVPDASNTIQSLYIGVYTNDRGHPSVSLVSYSHTSQTLNCTSSGGPATNVTWRKNNVIIPPTSSTYQQSQRVAEEVTSTYHNLLSVSSSNMEDHIGSFSCTVENNRGSSENYLLDINKIELSGNQSTYQLGSLHRITCSSDLTVQSIQWLNTSDNGEILTSNTGEQQLVLELADFTAAINNTLYTCEVTLTLQTTPVAETIHLVVSEEGSPRHPESVIVVSSTISTGVTIQWMLTEPFNATRPETFVVLYGTTQDRLSRTSTSMVIATATSQTYSIQLNSLDIGTQYYFQVQSRNRFGSVVSNVIDFTTDDTMSGPVRDLQTNSPDNSTLVISWRPPTTPNGNILSYTVTVENLRDGTTLKDIVDPSAATTSITENSLVPGVPYLVSVAAVNLAGQGNITTLTNFTKELEPNHAPKNIKVDRIHPTLMIVSWIPLTLSEARGFIISYAVFYSPQVRRKRQEPNTMQKTVSGDVNRTTIHDLDPNTAYDVQMSANTKAGASALSKSTLSEVISSSASPDTGDVGGLLIVIVVALVVVLVLILVIILLVLRMQRTAKTRNKELVELWNHNIADQSVYEMIKDTANTQDNVEEIALPVHLLDNSSSAARGEEDVEDKKNDVY